MIDTEDTRDLPDENPSDLGRPPFYDDPEEMEERIDEYFRLCDEGKTITRYNSKKKQEETYTREIPYTVPGLCDYLGFESRNALRDYGLRPIFASTIARARQRIERQRVENALLGEQEPRFAMFDLTNNFGYKAEQDIVINPVKQRTYTAIEEQSLRAQALADARLELERQQAIEHTTADIEQNGDKTTAEDGPGGTSEGELV